MVLPTMATPTIFPLCRHPNANRPPWTGLLWRCHALTYLFAARIVSGTTFMHQLP